MTCFDLMVSILMSSVSESEVLRALKEIANGKAHGINYIPIELFRAGGNDTAVIMARILNRMLNTTE